MKLKHIALGCSLAVAAFAASAAGTVTIGGNAYHVVYLSGASGSDSFLSDIANSMLSGVSYFKNVSGNGATQQTAYAGTANGIPGITNGTRILFIKRSKGGSGFGVAPVARGQRIETIDVTNCATGSGTSADPYVCGTIGLDPGTAGANTNANTGMVPDFGVSDVEPNMFQEPYNTENDAPALSPVETSRLTAKPVYQLIETMVATDALPATTVLTRANYGAIMSNQIQTWDKVDPSLSGDVAVCRRVEGSGTQTAYNWYFNHFPCATAANGATGPVRMTDSYGWKYDTAAGYGLPDSNGNAATGVAGSATNPYVIEAAAGFTVIENSGSGDVRNCLTAANNGSNYYFASWDPEEQKTNYFVATFANSGPMKAIGVLSLDSYNKENGWHFRMMNGAGTFNAATQTASAGATGTAPSKANLLNGNYDFEVEQSMQYRNTGTTNEQGDSAPAISGLEKAFADELIARAGSPKYTGNFQAPGSTSVPNAFASLPQYYAGLTDSNGSATDGNGVRYADLYVSKYSRNANTCKPLQYYGN